ncbi:hypothetical protein CIK05_00805 [Bdellovibrio sp. qaytius]|nr:hypothetical protein CIK05_00805 [Bdellovibrio sp. qaytius]
MKKLIQSLIMPAVLLVSVSASAYDVDTHFYGTYSMARFAGIKHPVAAKLALGAQWMDEAYISDPLSMIVLPLTGIKKRRLLHFPGSPLSNKLRPDELMTKLTGLLKSDPSSGLALNSYTETEADHEFATELFTEGLMEGDLMKAGAGLHTLEDSFAHAGTIAELGHAHFWHHPDRPFADAASVEKYFKMSRSVLKAMVAIRSLLPADQIDNELAFSDQGPNATLSGDQLADLYHANQIIHDTVSRKIFNEPTFVDFVMADVFSRAVKVGYVKSGYEQYLKNYTPGQDAYEAAESISQVLPQDMVNMPVVLKDLGRPTNLNAYYVVSIGGAQGLMTKVVHGMLNGIVPRPLNEYHRFEKEEDGAIWDKEMSLRVSNMRRMILNLFSQDIYFVPNNTNSRDGYLLEITKSPKAVTPMPKDNGVTDSVTYSLDEKYKFNRMIFTFLFPKLSASLGNLDEFNEMMTAFHDPAKDEITLANMWDKSIAIFNVVTSVHDISGKISLALDDLEHARVTPNEYNRYYAVPYLLRQQISKGNFKPMKYDGFLK